MQSFLVFAMRESVSAGPQVWGSDCKADVCRGVNTSVMHDVSLVSKELKME